MVAKVEDKCQNMIEDIADMAMSEQYLRTKQALLKAKKKEQEMKIAQNMASLREDEVVKMREKVAKMQVRINFIIFIIKSTYNFFIGTFSFKTARGEVD